MIINWTLCIIDNYHGLIIDPVNKIGIFVEFYVKCVTAIILYGLR